MINDVKPINKTYRHKYHLMPEYGWMNDPNGFSFFQNEYHLFYQHYPYDTEWGPMHWAHAVSSDLITWRHKEIALRPDQEYDRNGVFSGSGIQVGNEHWLYYTGHVDVHLDQMFDQNYKKRTKEVSENIPPFIRQVQCLATSVDGVHYKKYQHNPVISSDQIPTGIKVEDFRDPKVWKYNDKFYMVVGAKSEGHIGHVLFYDSIDGIHWNYLNQFTLGKDYGTVWECPDLFELDGKHILLFSPQEKPRIGSRFENIHSTMALIGSFNHSTGEFMLENEQELDQGFDFYAPQSTLTSDGRRVVVAWMNMWERKYPLHELGHGWNGSMTLPRELSLVDGNLLQRPYHTVEKYQKNRVEFKNIEIDGTYENNNLHGTCQRMQLEFFMKDSNQLMIEFFKGEKEGLSLLFRKDTNEMIMDRRNSEYPTESLANRNDFTRSQVIDLSKPVNLNVFLDVSSIEVFVNHGTQVFTSLFFSKEEGEKIFIKSNGKTEFSNIVKWDLD